MGERKGEAGEGSESLPCLNRSKLKTQHQKGEEAFDVVW